MKLSETTQKILKNFAGINANIGLCTGNKLATISPQRNVVAFTTITETFDEDFYIYDLNQFLGVLSLFSDPDIDFTSKVATIKEGKNSIRYFAADPSVLLLAPDKAIKFPGADVEFTLDQETLASIHKTSSVLSAPDLSFVGDGKTLTLRVSDLKNTSTNSYEIEFGETDKEFCANISVANLKMISGSYTVQLAAKGISKWVSTTADSDMTVYVALESSSNFK
jgi:hypothetical protein